MVLDGDDTCKVLTPESMCDSDPTPASGPLPIHGAVATSQGDALPTDATSSPSSARSADGRSETPDTEVGETGSESKPAVAGVITLTKDPAAATKPARRRPIPRKGHTKSRRGCYNCKRRKVKCPEGLPQCQQCCRLGLKCEYPPPKVAPRGYDRPMPGAPNSSSDMIVAPAKSLDSAPLFCLDDMRFMQHFLTYGHPSMPIGDLSVWIEVGKMAHSYEFLMHSILGLAAFHLDQFVPDKGYDRQALQHRLKAIKQINEFLTSPKFSIADGDAAFSALLTLIYQTSYIEDAVHEYITMMRGCYLVLMQAMPNWSLSRFESFTNNINPDASSPVRTVAFELRTEQPVPLPPPLYHTNDALSFHNSIGAVVPHCRTPMEHAMLVQMQRAVRAGQVDAMVGFREASAMYNMFGQMSDEEFSAATNPDDALWPVILAHFILVDYVVGAHLPLFHGFSRQEGGAAPLSGSPRPIKGHHDRRRTLAKWVWRIWQGLKNNVEMRQLVDWPLEFVSCLLEMPREMRPLGLPPPPDGASSVV